MTWLDGEWSDYFPIICDVGDRWYSMCKDSSGVYRLIALDDVPTRKIRSIPRACAVDYTGTLYIGKSKNLKSRLGALVSTHDPEYATKKHKRMPNRLSECFEHKTLAICWEYAQSEPEALIREGTLLKHYREAFGENPPLND